MSNKVDLHTHSYYSDGELSPTEVMKWAKEQGITKVALTDHDTVEGVLEAKTAGEALNLTVIEGVELSSVDEHQNELHILGYHINVDDIQLKDVCMKASAHRQKRNEVLFGILEDEFGIKPEEFTRTDGISHVGKFNIAQVFARKGIIEQPKDAFAEGGFFTRDDIKKIKKESITAKEAIEVILGAGGIPVLAHPGRIKGLGKRGSDEFYENLDKLIGKLKEDGLKGLECIYSSHSESETLKFVEFAKKYQLTVTQGSDFHGEQYSK